MGSCMSSETKKPKTPKGAAKSPKDSSTTTTQRQQAQERDPFFRNPPPPPPEEEKVKEVLSETPKRTSSFITRQIAHKQQQQQLSTFSKQSNDQKIQINGGNGDKKQHQIGKISTPEKNADQPEVSQTTTTRGDEESVDVSETVSMSESGVSMPATDDGNPDEVVQVQSRRKKRSSGSGSFSDMNRDSHSSRRNPSPSRRQEPSPARTGRTPAAPRSVNGTPATDRKGSFRRNGELGPKNNNGTRRSRSPATRVESGPVNRTNSSRNMKSPSRNLLPGGKNQSGNGPPKAGEKEEGRMQDGSPLPPPGGVGANNESLENPLVSLECFIFL